MKIGLPAVHAEDWTNVSAPDGFTHAVGFSADMAGAFARLVILHLQTPGGIATVLHSLGYESITYYASSKRVLAGNSIRAQCVRVARNGGVILMNSFVGDDLLPEIRRTTTDFAELCTLDNTCRQMATVKAGVVTTISLFNAINALLHTAKATDMRYVWDSHDGFTHAPYIQVVNPKKAPSLNFHLNSLIPQVVKAGDISTDELLGLLL